MEALHSRQHGRKYGKESLICSHIVDVEHSQLIFSKWLAASPRVMY
jgi:hypothetical protein